MMRGGLDAVVVVQNHNGVAHFGATGKNDRDFESRQSVELIKILWKTFSLREKPFRDLRLGYRLSESAGM
jgi:hypothetical protein